MRLQKYFIAWLFVTFIFCVLARAEEPLNIVTFQTKLGAENSNIPADATAIHTLGYRQAGDGAGLYLFFGTSVPKYSPQGAKDVDRPASHFIASKPDASGARRYFVLTEDKPNVMQFGAVADAAPDGKSTSKENHAHGDAFDNTTAFNDALSYGKSVFISDGRYWINGTVKVLEDGTTLAGNSPAGGGGAELFFGPGTADCIQIGDGSREIHCCTVENLSLDPTLRTGGNAIFAWFNSQLTLEHLRIVHPYDGIRLFRGLGFMLRDLWISGIRAGNGTASAPTEIGYGIKIAGAPVIYDKETGKATKRETQVMYLENISFGSQKVETDPTNWTVGLWCGENAASVNGATVKNQNVRHGAYITRAAEVDPNDKLMVPDGYTLVPATWTDTAGSKGLKGKTYNYGSKEYPPKPGTVVDFNVRYQDLTLFYMGGDFLGGEFIYDDDGAGVAIYNPHFFRVYQGNGVYMGPNAKDFSLYGGQVIAPFKNCFDMNGSKWQISGVEVYKPSLDDKNRDAHKGQYSAIHVGATSIGGDILNCKIGNEPRGMEDRAASTAKFGIDVEQGAKSTWYSGNRIDGCLQGNVNNRAGNETQAGSNFMGPVDK